jgi:hypothetical protein
MNLNIVIDSQLSPPGAANVGKFLLSIAKGAPSGGDQCDTAKPIPLATTISSEMVSNFTNDYWNTGTNCVGGPGPDRVYSLTVGAGKQLAVTATPSAGLDLALSLVANAGNCGVACLGNADWGPVGVEENLVWTNTSGSARTVLIVVDSFGGGVGSYSIRADTRASAVDDYCDGATTLTAGASYDGQTTVGYADDFATLNSRTCAYSPSGADRVHRIVVPGGRRGIVRVDPGPNFDALVNIVAASSGTSGNPWDTCEAAPLACQAGVDFYWADGIEQVAVNNASGSDKVYYVIVDSAGAPGVYGISYDVDIPPAGDTCSKSVAFPTLPGTVEGSLNSFEHDYGLGTDCDAYGGPDGALTVTVPAGKKLHLWATPNQSTQPPILHLLTSGSCDSPTRTCTASAASATSPVHLYWTNELLTGDRTMQLIVGTVAPPQDFVISGEALSPPIGEACAFAEPLSPGFATNESMAGYSREYGFPATSTSCAPYRYPERVYKITIPANRTLDVRVTPRGEQDVVANLLASSSCTASSSCASKSDIGGAGVVEMVSHRNSSTTASKDVFLVVAAESDVFFDLQIDLL